MCEYINDANVVVLQVFLLLFRDSSFEHVQIKVS